VPGRETAPGFLRHRGRTRIREQAKVFPPMRPTLAHRIDIHCYLRRVATHILGLAREFIRNSQFSLLFTIARPDFAGEFGARRRHQA
jgi:hypothetical protein